MTLYAGCFTQVGSSGSHTMKANEQLYEVPLVRQTFLTLSYCSQKLEPTIAVSADHIPAEVLGDVFLLCLPAEVRPRLNEAPLSFCLVNSFW
ncbi:hypothetical protein Hypma_006144 [Hypsizygus marmoreus]|uniref:Uncharacterized protein n=1 Tax=Hypsizygus marmoreus TaxID=39966 RepID=A0A369K1A1_HYPMA|nr:hypothetical protein Hypma_006144 [Hypsizygus marmoreus]